MFIIKKKRDNIIRAHFWYNTRRRRDSDLQRSPVQSEVKQAAKWGFASIVPVYVTGMTLSVSRYHRSYMVQRWTFHSSIALTISRKYRSSQIYLYSIHEYPHLRSNFEFLLDLPYPPFIRNSKETLYHSISQNTSETFFSVSLFFHAHFCGAKRLIEIFFEIDPIEERRTSRKGWRWYQHFKSRRGRRHPGRCIIR